MENAFVVSYFNRVETTGSILCPRISLPERIPPGYRYPKGGNYFQSAKDYLYAAIDGISGIVPAVEFQKNSYSARGKEGENLLKQLIEHAQSKNLCVILDKEDDIEMAFGEYGVDACTFISTPNFPSWNEWLKRGHMPIFAGFKTNPDKDPDCQRIVEKTLEWNTEVVRIHGFAGIGCAVNAKEAVRCREIAGDEVFFLISGKVLGGRTDEVIGGLMNSSQQLMGAVSNLDITPSWSDKERGQLRAGKTLDLVKATVQSANARLNAAIKIKV